MSACGSRPKLIACWVDSSSSDQNGVFLHYQKTKTTKDFPSDTPTLARRFDSICERQRTHSIAFIVAVLVGGKEDFLPRGTGKETLFLGLALAWCMGNRVKSSQPILIVGQEAQIRRKVCAFDCMCVLAGWLEENSHNNESGSLGGKVTSEKSVLRIQKVDGWKKKSER